MIPKVISYDSPSNARIGYANLLSGATIAGSEVVLTPSTYDRYLPASGAVTSKFQLSSIIEIDFIGIAAHNFGTHIIGGVPFTVSTAATIGGALTEVAARHTISNGAIMFLIDPVIAAEIAITHNTTAGLEYGVVYAGVALQMQRPIYGGHSPINLSRKTKYQSADSETGQFLSRTIVQQGVRTPFKWQHLDPDWYRNNFDPFVESARRLPFFIKWRPDLYDESAYGVAEGDISPSNTGGGTKLMSVNISMRGHNDT